MNTPNTAHVITVLDRLLVSCADGVEGYRHAAADVRDGRLARFLSQGAAEREEVAAVLTNTLVSLGYKPSHHGSVTGALHRGWIDTLGAIPSNAARSILHECQRGEQQTIAAFSATLGLDLPVEVRAVVEAQLIRILRRSAALNGVVRDLEDARAPSA